MRKIFGTAAFALALMLSFAAAPAHAATLTDAQIQAIVNLLSTFGADSGTIANVNAALHGQPTTSTTASGSASSSGSVSTAASSGAVPAAPSCISFTYNLYAGVTDATTGGDVTRLQNFLGVTPTGYFGPMTQLAVQNWQAAHGVVTSGSPDTTGFGFIGPATRIALACAGSTSANTSTAASTHATTTTTPNTEHPTTATSPTLYVREVSSSNISASYANLPASSQIWIVNASTGQPYTAQSTLVSSGGSGNVAIPVPSTLPSATYMLRAVVYSNQSQTLAQSGTFHAGVAVVTAPTCSLRADPSAVAPNIPTVLTWSSTGATNAQWVSDTSGKDNIPPPSGTPATSGSMSFTPSITVSQGTTQIPSVTLQVSGPGGSSTCTTYISVVASEQAAFDNTVFTQGSTPTPTISGTASGVSQVGVVLSNSGGKAYGSGSIPVVNGHWSVTVSPALATGSYFINVYDANNNGLVNGGYLNVVNSVPAPTCTLTPSSSTPSSYTTGYDYSVKPNSSVTLTWTSQNANYSVWDSGDKGDPSGSLTFNNLTAVTNNYRLTFYGNGGSTTCTAAVYVDYKG